MMSEKSNKRTRFAIYTRYSSEMQNEMSLEAQEDCCRRAIAERGGAVVDVFSDGAKSGWSLDRDGFNALRKSAERGKFDAVIFWKFDRLARNHDHVVMIKMLLRHEYGLKLYCVEGFSEDDDDSPYTAMMEQMLAVFSAFYSRNLSTETKRGKRQRVLKGEFNGSIPPLGYDLVTMGNATEQKPAGLYINPRQAAIVRRAFHLYASGSHSDTTIAEWMNTQKYIQQLRKNGKPVGKEMVRDMLQNKVYTGRVPYADTQYSGSLGQGKKSSRKRKEWFEGKHHGFVSDDLFEAAMDARRRLTKERRPPQQVHTYILHNRVYCARCVARKPTELTDLNFGKMRPGWNNKYQRSAYRCLARDRGYHSCEQSYIDTQTLDTQVYEALENLEIPVGFRDRVERAVRERVQNAESFRRMEEVNEIVKRIDFSWEQGFLSPDDYLEKRHQLQREIESLRPIDYDDLMEAADLLTNFKHYWQECEAIGDVKVARQQLIAKIVDRIFIYDDRVIGIALYGDFGVILDDNVLAPNDVLNGISEEIKKGANYSELAHTQSGSDGI